LPDPGETVLGDRVDRFPGGKGLNQAVAAARMGARVTMVGALGDDASGAELRAVLREESVDAAVATVAGSASGTALIEVAHDGENRIVVVPGANALLEPDDVQRAIVARRRTAVVLAQAEIPVPAVAAALSSGRAHGALTVLNASPAQPSLVDLLRDVDLVVVNEHEAAALTGLAAGSRTEADAAARELLVLGARAAVVTLGADGVVWATTDQGGGEHAAFAIDPVDTVGAGDAFCGALVAGLAQGDALPDALRRAGAAGAIAATRHGAVPSLPRAEEVAALVADRAAAP
jgi:ribokinase